ncbi:MAG: S41 family peptidase, partial [Verrucomicrobiota bacterium]
IMFIKKASISIIRLIKRHLIYVLLILLLSVNLVVGYSVYSANRDSRDNREVKEQLKMMTRVLDLVQRHYVNPDDLDYETLIYNATDGMVSSLDPHSSFLSPEEFKAMRQVTEGEFGGIGVVVTLEEGVLTIVAPIEDTPGSRAGLRAGDQIIGVDGEEIEEGKLAKIVPRLKGEPGTVVELKIYRPETEETLVKKIERAVIEVPSVKGMHKYDDDIGYIRITQFTDDTAVSIGETLFRWTEEGVQGLILDVRNNPGGLLDAAVDVAGFFLEEGKMVVYTERQEPSRKEKFYTENGGKIPADIPIVVLANEGSASAAEIIAGCLQDYERAVVVGTTTFGKGSVQNVMELADGSALRLTTAMYYTPSKRVIDNNGVKPDVEVELSQSEEEEFTDAQMDLDQGGKQLPPEEDPQLARALEILRDNDKYQNYLTEKQESPSAEADK